MVQIWSSGIHKAYSESVMLVPDAACKGQPVSLHLSPFFRLRFSLSAAKLLLVVGLDATISVGDTSSDNFKA